MKQLVTVRELAERLHPLYTMRTLRTYMHRGIIPAVGTFQGRVLYDPDEVIKALKRTNPHAQYREIEQPRPSG